VKNKSFKIIIGIIISAALIAWCLAGANLELIYDKLQKVHLIYLIPGTILWTMHFFCRAWRWYYLIPASNRNQAKLKDRFNAIMIGSIATMFLPLRPGEIIRPLFLASKSKVSFSIGFASVFVERIFDLSAVLLTFALIATLLPNMSSEVYAGAVALAIFGGIIMIGIVIGLVFPATILKLSDLFFAFILPRFAKRLHDFTQGILDGLKVIDSLKTFLVVAFLTALVWSFNFLIFWIFLPSVDVSPNFLLGIAATIIVALVVAAPSAPGFIGQYQFGCVAAFALFGISQETALAYALFTHAFQYLYFILYGIGLLLSGELASFSLSTKKADE
jgi:hypothetical protein